VTIVDATTCAPVRGAAVDVWHADVDGEYSGFDGEEGATHLRGIQLTDAHGRARFRTVYPGWYPGRAVHVHVKVHRDGTTVHTGQLFFPDELTDTVFRTRPYASRGEPDTRNEDDALFDGAGGREAIGRFTEGGAGYAGAITLGVSAA
jgi:protocatechuate 3,4-dioxygenase beta subunit